MHLGGASVLGALITLCSLFPHRGGRWKVNLFTTSAPGSGDELRLALCLPRAGPGLSHRGQMTAEAKWVLSCSPRELLHTPPFQSSQASLSQRERGWRWYKFQATTSSSSGQRTLGKSILLHLSPARLDPLSVLLRTVLSFQGQPSLSQCPSRMPQTPSVTSPTHTSDKLLGCVASPWVLVCCTVKQGGAPSPPGAHAS